jgi:hypothetical protein
MNDKPIVTIGKTSQYGQSLFVVRRPLDAGNCPYVSVQLPTEIAEWLKGLCDTSLNGPMPPVSFKKPVCEHEWIALPRLIGPPLYKACLKCNLLARK